MTPRGPRVPTLLHCRWGLSGYTYDEEYRAALTCGNVIVGTLPGGRMTMALLELLYGDGRRLDFGNSYASREEMLDAVASRSVDPRKYHYYET